MAERIEDPLLSIKNLSVSLQGKSILKQINLSLHSNEIVALVGESGSGKSVTAQMIMGLLPASLQLEAQGELLFDQQQLLQFNASDWENLRGKQISLVFQEPQSSLNPSMRCGRQVEEMGQQHFSPPLSKAELKAKVISAFEQVQLPSPERIYKAYPHELSGGQKQRVMIAMALLCQPKLLIADEPTTALDVLVQKEIMQLIKQLQKETKMSILFISHDLALVASIADRIAVMQAGKIVEQGETEKLFSAPKHPYTKGLLNARPPSDKRLKELPTLSHFIDGNFTLHAENVKERNERLDKLYKQPPLLQAEGIQKIYSNQKSFWQKKKATTALENISFSLYPGETLGLVGASGCGKSTLSKALVFLDPPTAGGVLWKGQAIDANSSSQINQLRKDIQFVFQDPYAALHPLKTIGRALEEVLKVHTPFDPSQRKTELVNLMEQVGLDEDFLARYPHQLSGGQRQRVVIARALAAQPKVLICDESVAALDISVQAQVLNLLNELKEKLQLSYLFISHDLGVVKHMADRIIVMHQGQIVEENEADALYHHPQTPFTKALLAAVV